MPSEADRFRVMSLRTSFAKQPLSNMKSSSSFGFGTSTRDQFARTYASPAVDKSNRNSKGGNYGTGPGAYNPENSSFGKHVASTAKDAPSYGFGQSERLVRPKSAVPGPGSYSHIETLHGATVSTMKSPPKTGFGTTTRDQAASVFVSTRHEKKQYASRGSPGPGTYQPPSSLFKSVDATKSTAPSWKMPGGERFKYDYERRGRENPGAGQYENTASIGQQAPSHRPTAPSHSFGNVDRDGASKVFMGTRASKTQFAGRAAPGAGTYNAPTAFGKQGDSRVKTAPSSGFGSSMRMGMPKSEVPGPGSYYAW
ncbi:unnamed protein product [Pedinophyceae sp. YPF-701]|nr:unnamed protein product [Pedinophyceae sp. YPF-701]